jgi:hypothetical protein
MPHSAHRVRASADKLVARARVLDSVFLFQCRARPSYAVEYHDLNFNHKLVVGMISVVAFIDQTSCSRCLETLHPISTDFGSASLPSIYVLVLTNICAQSISLIRLFDPVSMCVGLPLLRVLRAYSNRFTSSVTMAPPLP